jgi:serine/threonine protein kinase
MFCSVDALHQLGYIHRDLKPENFLIDATGHVKLTDFGLAAGMLAPGKIESMRIKLEQVGETAVPFGKPMDQRTVAERREGYRSLRKRDVNYAKSIVGSPDYMAPEVLKGDEYDFSVDYWSLGCMLFEALTGFPPFAGATVDETWKNLKHWREVLKKPTWEDPNYFISSRTWSFITRLVPLFSCYGSCSDTGTVSSHPNQNDLIRLRLFIVTNTSPRSTGHHFVRKEHLLSQSLILKLMLATLMISVTKPIWPSTRRCTISKLLLRIWPIEKNLWAKACLLVLLLGTVSQPRAMMEEAAPERRLPLMAPSAL